MHNKKLALAHAIFFFKLPFVRLNNTNRCCVFWKSVTVELFAGVGVFTHRRTVARVHTHSVTVYVTFYVIVFSTRSSVILKLL